MTGRRIVILGLSLSSAWGNGHATTWRALIKALAARGHDIVFLERDVPWYADHRDLPEPGFCELVLYQSLEELARFEGTVRSADAVIVGSFVPEGIAVGEWVQDIADGTTAFYDIDTPVTLAALAKGECQYLTPELVAGYDHYLSFSGGPVPAMIERSYGVPKASALYCSVDMDDYRPAGSPLRWDLGYLGTYSADRQDALERLLLQPAWQAPELRFVVAGAQYPEIDWPANVERIDHVRPSAHADFYSACRFSLNVTRADMVRAGYSPSVRLFEAAACGSPIISDCWAGLDGIFSPGTEILIADEASKVLAALLNMPETRRLAMAEAARRRVAAEHSSDKRAAELEQLLLPPATRAGALFSSTEQRTSS